MTIKLLIQQIFDKHTNRRLFRIFKVKCGTNLQIRGSIHLRGHNIVLGDDVVINSGAEYNPIGGDIRTVLVTTRNGSITIGNDVGISNAAIVAANSVTIGNHVRIGGGVKIYDTDFHSVNYESRISDKDTDVKTAPVVIEDGVFIGAHSIILKGVNIGKYSVVGAGSVVTKSIPSGEVWAGNPARYIRSV